MIQFNLIFCSSITVVQSMDKLRGKKYTQLQLITVLTP